MAIFYLLLIPFFTSTINSSYIEALNTSYPFRTGTHSLLTFSTLNKFLLTISPQLYFLPTQCFLGINAHNNQILTGGPNLKVITSANTFSLTSFQLSVGIDYPTYYSILSLTYAFFDPAWNILKFYSTGFVNSNVSPLTPAMIDNQPISKIVGLCLRSFEIAFNSPTTPFYISIFLNASSIKSAVSGGLTYLHFDITIITYNSSITQNPQYQLSWEVSHFSGSFATYGSQKTQSTSQQFTSVYHVAGVRSFTWNTKMHWSFSYTRQHTDYKYIWESNSSYHNFTFFQIYFRISGCGNPMYPYLLFRFQRCYDECPQGYYGDNGTMRCKSCAGLVNCTKCAAANTCAVCNPLYKMIVDMNGVCVECNSDPNDNASVMPLCRIEDHIVPPVVPSPPSPIPPSNPPFDPPQNTIIGCTLMRNNTLCQTTQFALSFTYSFTTLVSIPTINILTSAFSQLIGLFDDFSYYLYHNRIYSKQVLIYFELANNFTLDKFYPPQLKSFINQISLSYSNTILYEDLNKTPSKFQDLDNDIYFIKNMQSFVIGTIILSVVCFLLVSLFHYLTNKCQKHSFLQRYHYFGMLAVNLFNGNIQYISFRCFEQLYQIVPLSPIYYFNLIVCYLLLLFMIIYSLAGTIIFKSIYIKLKRKYVQEQLFQIQFRNWFIISNLLKITNGFIHSYFHQYPFLQQGLLTVSYTIKFIIFFSLMRRLEGKLVCIIEIVSNIFMFVFQCLIFIQLFMIQGEQYDIVLENNVGEIEFCVLIMLFVLQIIEVGVNVLKEGICFVRQRVCKGGENTESRCFVGENVRVCSLKRACINIKQQRRQNTKRIQLSNRCKAKLNYCQQNSVDKSQNSNQNQEKTLKIVNFRHQQLLQDSNNMQTQKQTQFLNKKSESTYLQSSEMIKTQKQLKTKKKSIDDNIENKGDQNCLNEQNLRNNKLKILKQKIQVRSRKRRVGITEAMFYQQ